MDPRNGNVSEGAVNGPLPMKCAQMVSGEHTCFDSLHNLLEVQLQ